MFNKTVFYSPNVTKHVTTTVNEHRAPTDESVRLLREMEDKVREEVLKSIRVNSTHFECVLQYSRTIEDDTINLGAIFSLNGKKIEVIVSQPSYEKAELLPKLKAEVAERIAIEVLQPALGRLKSNEIFGK